MDYVHLLGDAASIALVVLAVVYWKKDIKPVVRGLAGKLKEKA